VDDLTPAEQAVRDALHAPATRGDVDGRDRVRRIVAAVRPLIEAEALTALADDIDRHSMGGADSRTIRVRAGYAVSHPRKTGDDRG